MVVQLKLYSFSDTDEPLLLVATCDKKNVKEAILMKKQRKKLKYKRVLLAVILLIVAIIFTIKYFSVILGLISIGIIIYIISYGIKTAIQEWKLIITVILVILSISFFETTTINILFLGFFFNIAYMSLSFNPQWERRKIEIRNKIETSELKDNVTFNGDFYNQFRDRTKAIITMFFYAISILPSITINILKDNAAFIKSHFPQITQLYYNIIKSVNSKIISGDMFGRIGISFVLALVYTFITLLLVMKTTELKMIYDNMILRSRRNEEYWNENKPLEIDEDDLIFVDVVNDSSEIS